MLNDAHIYQLNDYLNAKPFYSKSQSVTLRGGVNIFFWDNVSHDKTKVNLFIDKDNIVVDEERMLLPEEIKSLMINNNIIDRKVDNISNF